MTSVEGGGAQEEYPSVEEGGGELVRTFTVDQDFGSISVCAHEDSIIVNLRIRQASLAVDNFQELQGEGLVYEIGVGAQGSFMARPQGPYCAGEKGPLVGV